MFESKTVIIVGAGASAEFGVPTGVGVFKEALKLEDVSSLWPAANFSFRAGFRKYLSEHPDRQLVQNYELFRRRVAAAVAPSIDRLAWLNEDISELCRAFSAWSILKHQYNEQVNTREDYGRPVHIYNYTKKVQHLNPFVGDLQNWIAKCADKWLGTALDSSQLSNDTLSFVSFNYDKIIEEAFLHFVSSTKRFEDALPENMPKVHHVHGAFPSFPATLSEPDIYSAQRCIKYIEDGGDEAEVIAAKRCLREASHIISVGFDFDPKNVDLLSLNQYADKMHVLNFDGNEAFDNRVITLGVNPAHIVTGTPERKLGVSHAASRGFFDRAELLTKR